MANIMIVDDDKDLVALVKHVLEQVGHHVSEAYHGADALEKLGIEPEKEGTIAPDLIILDVMMPVIDGYSVTLKLASNPRTRPIPILVLTAKDKMREQFESNANVAAFVVKPFEVKNLQALVSKLLPSPS